MLLQISHLMMNMMWKYKKGLHHTLGEHIKKDLHQTLGPDIQIKICAEYWDMLPRPRLVFQEPGLRPIGRSPGVPDKSSRGLGTMSRYSVQILICFIAYILFFFHSSVGLVGNFVGLHPCTVPSVTAHCHQNEAGHQTIKAPSMPCWGAAGPQRTLSGIYAIGLVKLTDKMDEIWINGKLSVQESSEWGVFCIPVSSFTVLQPRI